jgi:hypothetical protein
MSMASHQHRKRFIGQVLPWVGGDGVWVEVG